MERHGLERVMGRNQFYWDNYRQLSFVFIFLLILLLCLGGFIIYQRYVWPTPKYFATTPEGRPIPVVSLALPLYSSPDFILQWISETVVKIYSLDYVTWRKSLQDADSYFTPSGYKEFIAALKASTNLEAIKAKRQVVSLTVTSPATITRQGQVSANLPYSWDIQMPVLVVYQNSEGEMIQQRGTVLARVDRTSLLRYKEGIAIAQLVLQAQ